MRIDDTDFERSKPEFEAAIERDLTWLGLNWDEKERQSERAAIYEAAAEKLKSAGMLYPCYETADELERKRRIAQSRGRPPVYDRAALAMLPSDRATLEAQGQKPHWRFKLSGARVTWIDLIRGEQAVQTSSLSDPVLIRADGAFLYTLPSVVDDVDLGVTHVVRGEDHVTNTGAQIEIFRALGIAEPTFGHFPLLVGADGEALSKRLGSLSIEQMRDDGLEPMAVLSVLGRIGTSDPVEAVRDLASLTATFDFSRIGRAPARFDLDDVARMNAQLLHTTEYTDVKQKLAAIGSDLGEVFWNAVRANVVRIGDVKGFVDIVHGNITPIIEDHAFAAQAAALLPPAPWDNATWSSFVNAVKEATGAKGKALFQPLRLALTGQSHGPEMAALFPLIGPERSRTRLQSE